MFFTVGAYISQIKSLRHLHIQLYGSALPCPSYGVFQMEVQFRTVESSISFIYNKRHSHLFYGVSQGVFSHFPFFIGSHRILWSRGKLYMIFKSEHLIYVVAKFRHIFYLFVDLLGKHEYMGVVLSKGSYSHQPVKSSRKFVPVNLTQFAAANRKFPVGPHLSLVYQHGSRTVHRLDGVIFVIYLSEVHIIFIMIPMSGRPPQLLVEDQRRFYLFVSSLDMLLSPERFKTVSYDHSLRKEERKSRTFFRKHKEVHLSAYLAVVALLSFFYLGYILIQELLRGKCGSIDPLQHLLIRIASPVSSRYAHELKCLDLACGLHMRSRAQIYEVSLLVKGDHRILRKILYQFYFIWLACLFHIFDSFCSWKFKSFQRIIGLNYLLHFFLNLHKVFFSEFMFRVEVIIKSVLDSRAYGQLCVGPKAFNRLRHNMGSCVTIIVPDLFVFPV